MAQYFQVMLDNISPHPPQKTSIKTELDLNCYGRFTKNLMAKKLQGVFPGAPVVKTSNAEDVGTSPGWEATIPLMPHCGKSKTENRNNIVTNFLKKIYKDGPHKNFFFPEEKETPDITLT